MTISGWRSRIPRKWKMSARRAIHSARGPRPAILMYHRIAEETFDPWGLAVAPHRFAEQMDGLSRTRSVLPLDEFAALHRMRKLPRDAVCITFDDGYACTLTTAAPTLARLGLPATIFVAAELVERRQEFWWDELARIVCEYSGEMVKLGDEVLRVPPAEETDSVWRADEPPSTPRQALFQTIWTQIHKQHPGAVAASMVQLRSQAGKPAELREAYRPLTPEEIRSGWPGAITFGSHALTHASLPALTADEKEHEIAESRSRCAKLTGSEPSAFAYPHGDLDAESVRLVEEAGYTCACATGDRFVRKSADMFVLPRIRVGNWEAAHLRDMLGG